jgi:hypothetical protein
VSNEHSPRTAVKSCKVGTCRIPAKPDTSGVDDERAPICPTCGVTMVAAELSAIGARDRDWVCLECEETGEPDEV